MPSRPSKRFVYATQHLARRTWTSKVRKGFEHVLEKRLTSCEKKMRVGCGAAKDSRRAASMGPVYLVWRDLKYWHLICGRFVKVLQRV